MFNNVPQVNFNKGNMFLKIDKLLHNIYFSFLAPCGGIFIHNGGALNETHACTLNFYHFIQIYDVVSTSF